MKPVIHENLSRAEYLVFMFHILCHRNIKAETLYDTFFFPCTKSDNLDTHSVYIFSALAYKQILQ